MPELTVYEARFLLPPMSQYALHMKVRSLVGPGSESVARTKTGRSFLFRADEIEDGHVTHIRIGIECSDNIQLTPVTYKIDAGRRYEFAFKAVPVDRESVANKRITTPLINKDAIPWLERQAESNGFTVERLDTVESRPTIFFGSKRNKITINDTLFNGVLKVTDVAAFSNAVLCGIGRNKSFGFGMLQLIREVE